MINRRQLLLSAAALPLSTAFPAIARTGSRAARIVVGFPPGGGTDVAARLLANTLRARYPGGLLVDNRPGAAARIAVDHVKASPPDGATMLFTPDFVLTIYPHSYARLSYDPLQDFRPVTMCSKTAYAVSAGPRVPAHVRNIGDFTDWCRSRPSEAAFASTAAGGATHFAGVMLSQATGMDILHVPYKGGAPALQDLIGGQIPLSINPIGEVLPHLGAGKLRVLATTGPARSRFLPTVPTLVESGLRGAVVEAWLGLLMPAQTPQKLVGDAASAVSAALREKDVKEGLARLAMESADSASDEFAAVIRRDLERWRPVVKGSGFVADE